MITTDQLHTMFAASLPTLQERAELDVTAATVNLGKALGRRACLAEIAEYFLPPAPPAADADATAEPLPNGGA
jgi:hypothetical protein